jgi:hypothetical protein
MKTTVDVFISCCFNPYCAGSIVTPVFSGITISDATPADLRHVCARIAYGRGAQHAMDGELRRRPGSGYHGDAALLRALPSGLRVGRPRGSKLVWPGDTPRVRVTYEGRLQRAQEELARFSLETVNERGEVVLTGRAHSRVAG